MARKSKPKTRRSKRRRTARKVVPKSKAAAGRKLGSNQRGARSPKAAKITPKSIGSGGGAATTAGTTFQEDVASYFVAMVLAERGVCAPLSLPSDVTLESVSIETDQSVDDILVETSAGGLIFMQCKSSLSLSGSATSELAKCARQMVEQFRKRACRDGADSRALDPARDRLVLALGPRTSQSLASALGGGLEALRTAGPAGVGAVTARQSKEVQGALATLKRHCNSAWRSLSGKGLPSKEWSRLARLVHVWRIDLGPNGADRVVMDQTLRTHVVSRPRDAARACRVLTTTVRTLGPRRSSIDRRAMQETLLAERIRLKTPLGYAESVAALRVHSKACLETLRRSSEIEFGHAPMKVRRPAVDAIREMASTGHCLVVGEPGAGKSGCMHDLASGAMAGGADVVLLAADAITTASLSSLSADLRLPEGQLLPDVLANWVGSGPGYLLIDALDSARSRDSIPTLRNLVEKVSEMAPRWRVVASMREFDLQHSQQVQDLFKGTGHTEHSSPAFRSIRHVYVRRLSDDELRQAREQCPPLDGALSRSTTSLTDLIRNPFNLNLLVGLLAQQLDEHLLASVKVQVQLLDLYWKERVADHDRDRSRELTASALVAAMREHRTLYIDEVEVVQRTGFAAAALVALQEQGVVRAADHGALPGSSRRISFAHNILFDYAVARLWMQELPDEVLDSLALSQNEDLLLFARPSLVFAFERLWYADDPASPGSRQLFWSRAIELASREQMRLMGRVAAAGVAASQLQRLSEAEPLLQAVSLSRVPSLGRLLECLVTAVLTYAEARGAGGYLWGDGAPDWLGVAASISDRGLRAHVWLVRSLVASVQHRKGVRLTVTQRQWVNAACRRLLEWAWSDHRLVGLVPIAIGGACRSLAAAPRETIAGLEPVLGPALTVHRHEFFRPLVENLHRLLRHEFNFTRKVIKAVFATRYERDDRVPRGQRLMQLSVSKQDELNMVRRLLFRSLRRVFQRTPVTGTRLLMAILSESVRQRSGNYGKGRVRRFEFGGQQCRISADYSHLWGDRGYGMNDSWFVARKLLIRVLVSTARSRPDRVTALISTFARRNRYAIGWTTLLRAGRAEPAALGVHLVDLLSESVILRSDDTRTAAGELIAVVWSFLADNQRRRIEESILELDPETPANGPRSLSLSVIQLLSSIPARQVTTEAAKQRLAAFSKASRSPDTTPTITTPDRKILSQSEFRGEQGVPRNEPENQQLFSAIETLRRFTSSDTSRRLMVGQVAAFWPTFEEIAAQLTEAPARGVHATIIDEGRSTLLECAARMANAVNLQSSDPWVIEMRRLLREASTDPSPEPSVEEDSRWDASGATWSSRQGRVEAAVGLMGLARSEATCTVEILAAVDRLARDPHPAVRFQILIRLLCLWDTAPKLMWKLIGQTAGKEPRRAICRHFASEVLLRLPSSEATRVDQLFATLYNRLRDNDDDGISASYATHLLRRALWGRHGPSEVAIQSFVARPLEHVAELRQLVSHARGLMVYRKGSSPVRDAASVREWAFDFLGRVLNPLIQEARAELDRHQGPPPVQWRDEDVARLRNMYSLADHVANQVYFASGAFHGQRNGHADESDSARDAVEVARFFKEGRPLLDQLARVEFCNIAHDVLQTLEFLIPHDPVGVFRMIHQSIMAAQRDGLQYESMAADLVVGIIERYLAEYRGLLFQRADVRSELLDILDVFATSGWPKAIRLINRLDQVVR